MVGCRLVVEGVAAHDPVAGRGAFPLVVLLAEARSPEGVREGLLEASRSLLEASHTPVAAALDNPGEACRVGAGSPEGAYHVVGSLEVAYRVVRVAAYQVASQMGACLGNQKGGPLVVVGAHA